QSFVTAMRIINGDEKTRRWLRGIKEMGVTSYSGEFSVTNSVAEGEIGVGLANHYYTLRLKQAKPDAPLELAFTSDDAGSLINTSGGLVLSASDQQETATNLIRHFHTRSVQQHLTKNGYEYPLVPGVEPAGNLPPISQLNPPDINLSKLSNLQPTLKLLRDTEVL
ncbi:MAG: ABC transporter substrate-binding protein, partial [Halobacteria archaeon]|nr:ABC transporter substrate-binding protein [Halobacteria archaeon]